MTSVIDMEKNIETDPKDHPVLFEIGSPGACAVSLPESDVPAADRSKALPAELLADELLHQCSPQRGREALPRGEDRCGRRAEQCVDQTDVERHDLGAP